MSKRNRILVLGNFGYVTNQIDGQTVKTRNVYELLKANAKEQVDYFDTQTLQGNKTGLLKMVKELTSCRKLVYLPAQHNFKYFFPVIFFLSGIFRFNIYYFVVGGWVADLVKPLKLHQACLRKIAGVFSETKKLKHNLESWYGMRNVHMFPNFRIHNHPHKVSEYNSDVLKVVFMSRVTKKKGTDVIFRFLRHLQQQGISNTVQMDFYGPLPKQEEADFVAELSGFDNAQYKGVVPPAEVYKTLSGYDVMVLPSRYEGEGFPGAILDAYIAGIPVIASDWRYNSEFVEHGKTGFIFPLDAEEEFYQDILTLGQNAAQLQNFKQAALEKSKEYDAGACWQLMQKHLGLT